MRTRVLTVGSLIPGAAAAVISPPQVMVKELKEKVVAPAPAKVKPIVVVQNQNRYEIVPVSGTLLEIALAQGKPIQYKCQKGTCGQCKVKVLEGSVLSPPTGQEQKKLGKELNEGFRLACQAEVNV